MGYEMNKKYLAKILIICINILLLSLGIWQITRGQYKQHMLDLQKQATSSTDINLQELQNNTSNIKDIIYKHIKVEGKFLDLSFYLYRVYNGSSGYWLVNPFLIKDSNDIILIAHKFIVSPSKNVFL
jgi:cytochrome oxidase assembly protein ShyY1